MAQVVLTTAVCGYLPDNEPQVQEVDSYEEAWAAYLAYVAEWASNEDEEAGDEASTGAQFGAWRTDESDHSREVFFRSSEAALILTDARDRATVLEVVYYEDDTTCGTCGRTWSSIITPTPAGRCPFEAEHED